MYSKVKYLDISKLKPLDKNPRKIKAEKLEGLCISLKSNPEFFEARPIICSDRTGQLIVIAGNQRYHAAKQAGINPVPVCILSGLTEAKEKEITIRDNTNAGEWDWEMLGADYDVVELEAWGLDVPGVDMDGNDLGTDFTLPDGDKAPFQQMTFTLADCQAELIKRAIKDVDIRDGTQYGNENSNGNALHQIVLEWAGQRK